MFPVRGVLILAAVSTRVIMQTKTIVTLVALSLLSSTSEAFINASVGGHEGEIDINAHFIGEFGKVEPTERPTTFQSANVKILQMGAGYTIGKVGPLEDFYVRLEGGYYIAAEEKVEDPNDDLPVGFKFFDQDKGGFVTATISTNFVHENRFAFGVFLQGTVPIDVNFQKFSNVHLHYVAGGANVGVFITDPTKVARLAYAGRIFVGSGAYDGDFQHNAAIALTQLFVLEFSRWLLPWRMGIGFGPYFEGDLNEHVNQVYNQAYGSVTPDFTNGDRVRAMRFAVAVLPYFRITNHAALELGYVQKLFGYDPPATQFFTAACAPNSRGTIMSHEVARDRRGIGGAPRTSVRQQRQTGEPVDERGRRRWRARDRQRWRWRCAARGSLRQQPVHRPAVERRM